MRESNRRTAELLSHVEEAVPGSVRGVTDVSGFGLLEALRQIADNARVVLNADSIPRFSQTEHFIEAQAWSGLTDANRVYSNEYTSYGGDHAVHVMPILLNDPQTSGGLLALVSPEAWKVIQERGGTQRPVSVGRIKDLGSGFAVVVREAVPQDGAT